MSLPVLEDTLAKPYDIAHPVRESKFCSKFEHDELKLYKITEASAKCYVCVTPDRKKWCLFQDVQRPRRLHTVLKLTSNL
jgi:hypothetical protein